MAGMLGMEQPQNAQVDADNDSDNDLNPAGDNDIVQDQGHQSIMNSVQRVVLAAQKIMYSKQTHGFFMKQLDAFEDPREKAGMGALALIGILMKESGGKVDPRTVVPVGVILVADILDFIGKTTGQDFTEDDNKQAMVIFLQKITQLVGGGGQQQPMQQQPMNQGGMQQPMQQGGM